MNLMKIVKITIGVIVGYYVLTILLSLINIVMGFAIKLLIILVLVVGIAYLIKKIK